MDKYWLEDILILLEEGNMTRAAARRNITQPAFSRRVRAFEDWLGTPILKRGVNRIELSRALTENEEEMRAIMAMIRDLRGKIVNFDPARATIVIAAQHTSSVTTFPDLAIRVRHHYPAVNFRMRAANLRDCITMFLRNDASILLCYESKSAGSLPFDRSVLRRAWGPDKLIPVIGGELRHRGSDRGEIADDTPAIVYPAESYFGGILGAAERPFSTRSFAKNPVCETAFSYGIKEMVLKGLGIGWLPYSMCHAELENGTLQSSENLVGKEDLTIALYCNAQDDIACAMLDVWGSESA